jgi:putative methyltransferase (TIGR04325 family)
MFLKQFIPPILLTLFYSVSLISKRYENYEEAIANCEDNAYSNSDLVKVVIEKNIIYKNDLRQSKLLFDLGTLRTLIALSLSNKNGIMNVIDFGGGGGYHYTIASKVLGDEYTKLTWHVVETTEMVKEAKRIANERLKFYDDITEAAKNLEIIDLVFTSSALQYCQNPLVALRKLTDLNAKYLFITRTPFTESTDELITIQTSYLSANGPGALPQGFRDKKIKFPITYASRHAIENILTKKYEIRFMTAEEDSAFGFTNEKINMNGYYCVRKN